MGIDVADGLDVVPPPLVAIFRPVAPDGHDVGSGGIDLDDVPGYHTYANTNAPAAEPMDADTMKAMLRSMGIDPADHAAYLLLLATGNLSADLVAAYQAARGAAAESDSDSSVPSFLLASDYGGSESSDDDSSDDCPDLTDTEAATARARAQAVSDRVARELFEAEEAAQKRKEASARRKKVRSLVVAPPSHSHPTPTPTPRPQRRATPRPSPQRGRPWTHWAAARRATASPS